MDFLDINEKLDIDDLTGEYEAWLVNMTPPIRPVRFAIIDLINNIIIDHDNLVNKGDNDHSVIDSHIADTARHKEHGMFNTDLTLTTPWYGAFSESPELTRDSNNVCYLWGSVTGGNSNTEIMTLPVGTRPTRSVGRAVATNTGYGLLTIVTSGVVKCIYGSGWVCLDGASWRI